MTEVPVTLAPCRSCGAALDLVLDLGQQPEAGRFPAPGDPQVPLFPLELAVCRACGLAQAGRDGPDEVDDPAAPAPTSSATGAAHAAGFVATLEDAGLVASSRVLELASHGGYLRPFFARAGIPTTIVEVSADRAARLAAAGEAVVLDASLGSGAVPGPEASDIAPADLVVDHYLLAHLRRPRAALERLVGLVAPGGTLVLEFDHLLPTVAGLQFDAIRHGHRSYLALGWVERELARLGFRVTAAAPQPVYGGALRVTATADAAKAADPGVAALLAAERAAGIGTAAGFRDFRDGVERVREETLGYLRACRDEGRSVVGYGAPARAVTFLNAVGVGPDLLPATADRAPSKQGRLVPGVSLPIVDPGSLRGRAGLDVLVLTWDIAPEIRAAQPWIEADGGRFLVAVPRLTVLGEDAGGAA